MKPLYIRSVINSFGMGMISPFMSIYAVMLGACPSEMGWFRSLNSLSNNIMQVFWGELSDRVGRRVPFIVTGGLIVAILWVPMMFVSSVKELIILIAVQALLGSMTAPAWTALIGDLVPTFSLGRAIAAVSLWASVGSLTATLISGTLMFYTGGTLQEIFFIPFLAALFCGTVSSLVMLSVREGDGKKSFEHVGFFSDMVNIATQVRRNMDFVRYSVVSSIFSFFMSLSWPLFPITLIRVLKASMLDVAFLSVFQGAATILVQRWAGRLTDTIGRKPLMVISRAGLFVVPISYAFAPNIYILMPLNIFLGILVAFSQASITAYVLDVTPKEHRGSFIAIYNLILGTVYFSGSLIGGYLSDFTTTIFGLILGLQVTYLISAAGRLAGGLTFLTLRETLNKNSNHEDH